VLNEALRGEIGEAAHMTAILTDLVLFVCVALLMTGFMVAAEAWSSRRQQSAGSRRRPSGASGNTEIA